MKSDESFRNVYITDVEQIVYEESRKNYATKLKLDSAVELI